MANVIKMKTLAEIQAMDPNSIRQFLKDLRGVVAFLSQLTPTEYDDMLLTWLDLLLGTAPGAQGVLDNVVGNIPWDKLPWDKIMQYVLPALMQLVQKWIDSLGKGGNTTPAGMKFSSLARCA